MPWAIGLPSNPARHPLHQWQPQQGLTSWDLMSGAGVRLLRPGVLLRGQAGRVGVIIRQSGKCHHCPHGQSFGHKLFLIYSPALSSLPDLPEISVSHANLTVREGDNAVITCNGSGSPLPDVDWIVTGLQSINTHQVGGLGPCPLLVLKSWFTKRSKRCQNKKEEEGKFVVLSLQEKGGDLGATQPQLFLAKLILSRL